MAEPRAEVIFTPVETQRASEAIYKQISDKITNGEFQPGDRLPSERAMMDLFHRSRPTIREALRMLERNGLVQIIPGTRGALVTTPGSSTIAESLQNLISMDSIPEEDLLECRESIEMQSALWACERRTKEELAELEELVNELNENSEIDDIIRIDTDFHKAIAKASHNKVVRIFSGVLHQVVWETLKVAYDNKDSAGRKRMIREIVDDHTEIYTCIKNDDPQNCRLAMEKHMRKFQADILYI